VTEAVSQILIVEDSETQALQLRYLLEEEGWEVFRTATAEAALEELEREAARPDHRRLPPARHSRR